MTKTGFYNLVRGKYDDAVRAFTDALKFNSSNVASRYGLGVIFRIRGRNEEAKDHLEKALQANPESEWIWVELGIVHMIESNFDLAVKNFLKASKTGPLEWFRSW